MNAKADGDLDPGLDRAVVAQRRLEGPAPDRLLGGAVEERIAGGAPDPDLAWLAPLVDEGADQHFALLVELARTRRVAWRQGRHPKARIEDQRGGSSGCHQGGGGRGGD